MNLKSVIHTEYYHLKVSAPPHYSSRIENFLLSVQEICGQITPYSSNLIMEEAVGPLVPLRETAFMI